MHKRTLCILLVLCVGSGLFLNPVKALSASIQPGDVVINEFSAKGKEWVELYNSSDKTISLQGWYIDDKKCGKPSNPIGEITLVPGDYHVIKAFDPGWSLNQLSGDGETIRLCESHHGEIDRVAYGDQGGAPIAPKGSSTARTPNGYDTDDHARDWTIDPTPSKGKKNKVPPVALGASLRINEVNSYPPPLDDAIEFYNSFSEPVSIHGWMICDGDKWGIITSDAVVSPGGLLLIDPNDYGVSIKDEDVLYLFQPDGTRVDQIGFTYKDWERTFQRVPNGFGPNNGYDWDSSGGGNTWLYLSSSLGRFNVPLAGPSGGWVRWEQNRAAIGRLMQEFEAVEDICVLSDVVLAAKAAGFDAAGWPTSTGGTLLHKLHAMRSSDQTFTARELSCAILAAQVMGQDPRAFEGQNLVHALWATQNAQTGQFGIDLHEHAYVMLALRNVGDPIPAQVVDRLRALRTPDGAWARDGNPASGSADVETTALVIQALFAAGETDTAQGAFEYLQRMQSQYGGFSLRGSGAELVSTHADATALTLQAFWVVDEPLGNWTPYGTDPVGALLGLWDENARGYTSSNDTSGYDIQTTARVIQALERSHLVDVLARK